MESYFPAVSQLPGVVTKSHNVCNVGKGLKLVSKHAAVQAIRTEDLRCYRPKYHDIVIFHDGNAYPCCSVFNRSAKELCLGNANTESLKTLFNRAEGSLLIRTLKSVGFKAAYEIAVARDPGLKDILPPLSGAIDACSHCRDVFGNRKTAERMQAAFIGHEVDYIIGVLRTVERIEGSNVRDKIIAEISQASSN
jgi:hypothetical protein